MRSERKSQSKNARIDEKNTLKRSIFIIDMARRFIGKITVIIVTEYSRLSFRAETIFIGNAKMLVGMN